MGPYKALALGPCSSANTPDGSPLGDNLLYLDLLSDLPSSDARRHVTIECFKPCANPHDGNDMLKYLPAGLKKMQYVLNTFPKRSPPYHVTQDDVSVPLQRLEVEKITGHQSVRGRGGVIAVLYKRHWVGLSEPSWERENDLQLSRTHILRYWAGTPDQHRHTNRLYRRMRIGVEQRELSRNNGERFVAPGYACAPRAEWLRRYRYTVFPNGSPRLVQGRRWVAVAWNNQCDHDGGWSIPGPIFGRPGADQAFFPPGALHDLNGGRTRFLELPGRRSPRVPSGNPT